LEQGQEVEGIQERIGKRKVEKKDIEAQIAIEENRETFFTAEQIRAFLYSLKNGNVNDENNRRGIVNIFLNAVYLYDDKFTLILNGGNVPLTISDILLEEIEADNQGFEGSSMVALAPDIGILDINVEGMHCWVSSTSKIALRYMKNIAGLFLKERMLGLLGIVYCG